MIAFFLAVANAPFTIALIVTALFIALSMSGVLGLLTGAHHDSDGDGDADADADGDADADADGDADGDADADGDHDADHDHDGDDDGDEDDGPARGSLLVVGSDRAKLPLTLAWQTFAVFFGITGLVCNARWLNIAAPPIASLLWTIPVSAAVGFATVFVLGRLLKPILSSKETEATKRNALVGQIGTVISSRVTEEFGEIRLKDGTGNVVRVICKLEKGSRAPNEREQVVIVDCEDGVFFVAPLEDGPTSSKKRVAKESLEDPPPEDEGAEKHRAAP